MNRADRVVETRLSALTTENPRGNPMANSASSSFYTDLQPSTSFAGLDASLPATVILRLPAVKQRKGLSRATIYRKMQSLEFPAAKRLSANGVGWVDAKVEAWPTDRAPDGVRP
ncbi:AlpA family phage regulatory protein [Sphingomonas sp. PP-CE-3A-406]|uniref:AlpA family phage regulatory protein n=1 Tax=Sphingomonas sp. PP-CE-3A-406 TaxID=2135659 RepID=UPI00287B8924|nr:AlpA family phage regulatory protein [Sphingomonas sp. PP-CE-3A-406]